MVSDAGLTFIGPDPESISIMGSKLAAKEAVSKFDIPMVPGTDGAITNIKEARSVAESIGLPVLVKASAGGGGAHSGSGQRGTAQAQGGSGTGQEATIV